MAVCPYCRMSVEPARDPQGSLVCPMCHNTGTPAAQWGPPAVDPMRMYQMAGASAAAQDTEKKARHGMQEGICGIVFGALGVFTMLFGLSGLACGIFALVHGSQVRAQARSSPMVAHLHKKGRNAFILGLIATPLSVVMMVANILLIVYVWS